MLWLCTHLSSKGLFSENHITYYLPYRKNPHFTHTPPILAGLGSQDLKAPPSETMHIRHPGTQ